MFPRMCPKLSFSGEKKEGFPKIWTPGGFLAHLGGSPERTFFFNDGGLP